MKTNKLWGIIMMLIVLLGTTMVFSSCSKDDENENEDVPGSVEFSKIAAKYEIQSNSDYQSIELTESGNYVVIKNVDYSAKARCSVVNKRPSFIARPSHIASTRASEFDGVIVGKYTINKDGSFNLEGFGTVTINMEGGTAASITITSNGETTVVSANKAPQTSNSSLTQSLCRTWKITDIGMEIEKDGKKFSGKAKYTLKEMQALGKQISEWLGDDDYYVGEEEYLVDYIIFSKAGSYLVKYLDDEIGIARWSWENESKGLLKYYWYEDEENDPITVTVSGDKATIRETSTSYHFNPTTFNYDYYYTETSTAYLEAL